MNKRGLIPGEPAPWFTARCSSNEKYHFDSVAGRYIVLSFFCSAAVPSSAVFLQDVLRLRDHFDDEFAAFFGVSIDPVDEQSGRLKQRLPGIRFIWDADLVVSQLYGATQSESGGNYSRITVILDERLRVFAVVPFVENHPEAHLPAILAVLESLPAIPSPAAAMVQAPVLVVPRLFEPQLCKLLIEYYDRNGGRDSGFMREVAGKTVLVLDKSFKVRRDQEIDDELLRNAAMHRIHDRLLPQIERAFQFKATRIERHIVACYDSESGGYFSPHRDNTTKGTAHRRFAVSLNLNTGEYEGGKLRFPEFGRQTYEAPAGGAVVFSCSLLHEATPVTSGRRFAYLPFLYDDEAAQVREHNQQFLQQNTE